MIKMLSFLRTFSRTIFHPENLIVIFHNKVRQLFRSQKAASGGKVCHLESSLRMRFAPRQSNRICG